MTPLTVDFFGHSSFLFQHLSCGLVFVDPWLSGNPVCPIHLEDIQEANIVCVSHGHRDHLGDAIPICLKTGAMLVTTPEIAAHASRHGIPYEKQSYGLNIGGTYRRDGFAATMVQAFHTSEIQGRQYNVDRTLEPGSGASGFILDFGGEHRVYYTGDTGLFGDMKLFAEIYQPQIVILPIGGKYTMGPREAAKALELMRPPLAIPCHYDTFANQKVDMVEFQAMAAKSSPETKLILLKPGDTWEMGNEQ